MARACSVFQFLKYFCHPSEYLTFLFFFLKVNVYFLHSSILGGGEGGDLTTSLCVS